MRRQVGNHGKTQCKKMKRTATGKYLKEIVNDMLRETQENTKWRMTVKAINRENNENERQFYI